MDHQIDITIAGLGIIFYSPFAVAHIKDGSDYLESDFWDPARVAEHVMDCQLSAFGTGSPGTYHIRLFDGHYSETEINDAMAAIRLGVEIRDGTLCFRDLYDLMDWQAECPVNQTTPVPNGFYELTVFTNRPKSGILGDNQAINIHFRSVPEKPRLKWGGVPDISGEPVA
ncbi:MAG: hypothetical protein GY878_12700 [Fuerstiella sp.]|nr:hypothetical protein [Fuerstiella sp.]